MANAQIKVRPTVAYSQGRGGAKWPVTVYTAFVNGIELIRKDGLPRRFKTKAAALKAAEAAAAATA